MPARAEVAWINALKEEFPKGGYKIRSLIKKIATSPEFYRASSPQPTEADKSAHLVQQLQLRAEAMK